MWQPRLIREISWAVVISFIYPMHKMASLVLSKYWSNRRIEEVKLDRQLTLIPVALQLGLVFYESSIKLINCNQNNGHQLIN